MPGGFYHQLMMNNNRRSSSLTKRSRSSASGSQPSTPRRQRPRKNIPPPGSADSTMSSATEEAITIPDQQDGAQNESSVPPEDQNIEIQSQFFSENPFTALKTNEEHMEVIQTPKTPKPPPIFVRSINNFRLLCTQLDDLVGKDKYFCVSRQSDTKIIPDTPDTYRAIVKYLKETRAPFHTYQLQEERALRVVIRNLHHTTPIDAIIEDLTTMGFKPKSVINVIANRRGIDGNVKVPLPMFYVDLERTKNISDIYGITSLYHTKVKVEKPHPRRDIVQCFNCQEYGHARGSCNYTARCVKCGEAHQSKECLKSRNTPAVCALCSMAHPANYKGCEVYQKLKRRISPQRHPQPPTQMLPPRNPPPPPRTVQPGDSYANVVSSGPIPQPHQELPRQHHHSISHIPPPPNSTDLQAILQSFFTEFRSLITPLISLLTTVVSKLIPNSSP